MSNFNDRNNIFREDVTDSYKAPANSDSTGLRGALENNLNNRSIEKKHSAKRRKIITGASALVMVASAGGYFLLNDNKPLKEPEPFETAVKTEVTEITSPPTEQPRTIVSQTEATTPAVPEQAAFCSVWKTQTVAEPTFIIEHRIVQDEKVHKIKAFINTNYDRFKEILSFNNLYNVKYNINDSICSAKNKKGSQSVCYVEAKTKDTGKLYATGTLKSNDTNFIDPCQLDLSFTFDKNDSGMQDKCSNVLSKIIAEDITAFMVLSPENIPNEGKFYFSKDMGDGVTVSVCRAVTEKDGKINVKFNITVSSGLNYNGKTGYDSTRYNELGLKLGNVMPSTVGGTSFKEPAKMFNKVLKHYTNSKTKFNKSVLKSLSVKESNQKGKTLNFSFEAASAYKNLKESVTPSIKGNITVTGDKHIVKYNSVITGKTGKTSTQIRCRDAVAQIKALYPSASKRFTGGKVYKTIKKKKNYKTSYSSAVNGHKITVYVNISSNGASYKVSAITKTAKKTKAKVKKTNNTKRSVHK